MTPTDYGLSFAHDHSDIPLTPPKVKEPTTEHDLWNVYFNGKHIYYLDMFDEKDRWRVRVWKKSIADYADHNEIGATKEQALAKAVAYIKSKL